MTINEMKRKVAEKFGDQSKTARNFANLCESNLFIAFALYENYMALPVNR